MKLSNTLNLCSLIDLDGTKSDRLTEATFAELNKKQSIKTSQFIINHLMNLQEYNNQYKSMVETSYLNLSIWICISTQYGNKWLKSNGWLKKVLIILLVSVQPMLKLIIQAKAKPNLILILLMANQLGSNFKMNLSQVMSHTHLAFLKHQGSKSKESVLKVKNNQ